MYPLALLLAMLVTQSGAQRLPCELVPEQQLPNCHFTTRSNYALHGRVHTVRVIRHELAPDPRTRGPGAPKTPTLSIQEPGVWLVFGPDGDLLENAGSLAPDGTPLNPARESKTADGSTAVVMSGTPSDPNTFRSERKFARDGSLIEEFTYQHDKLLSHHVQKRDSSRRSLEDFWYDAEGTMISHSSESYDRYGRVVESIVFDHDRLVIHQRDNYDESSDADDANALISRAWYDKNGALFREIALRNGQVALSWQRPDCGEPCNNDDGVGFTFPFDYSNSYEFRPDGSLLTTIEHHKGRYGNIDNDDVELLNQDGTLVEKIAYRYVRDQYGNWIERTASILDRATGQMVDVLLDKRDLTYY